MSEHSQAADENPLAPSEDRDARIRVRAYHLWEADGCPEGRDDEYWERARELEAIASHPGAGQVPVESRERVDEADLQDNLGEFPDRFSDQGDRRATPMARGKGAKSA